MYWWVSQIGMIVDCRSMVTIADNCKVFLNVVARRVDVHSTSNRANVTSFKSCVTSWHGLTSHTCIKAAVRSHLDPHPKAKSHDLGRILNWMRSLIVLTMHKLRARLSVRHETRLFGVTKRFRRIRETYWNFFTVIIAALEKCSMLCIAWRQFVSLLPLCTFHSRVGSWNACRSSFLRIDLPISTKASCRMVKCTVYTVICDRDRRFKLLIC